MESDEKNKAFAILVYDDEAADSRLLTELLYEICGRDSIIVTAAGNFEEIPRLLTREFDAAFLDIKLDGELNGIALAEKLRAISAETKIVFVTAYIKYCEEVFHADPSGFIVKPITYEKVKKALSFLQYHQEQQKTIAIRHHGEIVRLSPSEISYVEISGRNLTVYDSDYKPTYSVKNSKLTDFSQKLPNHFIRCHYSYLLNMRCVEKIEHYSFSLQNGKKIPITQKKFAAVKERYLRFLEEDLL